MTQSTTRMIALLRLLRLFGALLFHGYVHPDGYFQSAEVVAGDLMHWKHVYVPWEYSGWPPNRSIVPPLLSAGLPFSIVKIAVFVLGPRSSFIPWLARILPRLLCFALSILWEEATVHWAMSLSLKSKSSKSKSKSSIELANDIRFCMASCWPLMTFGVRPFSNTLEAVCLSVAGAIACRRGASSHAQSYAFGAIIAAGFFTRFTFLLFAAPLGVYYLLGVWRRGGSASVARACVAVGAAGALVGAAFVLVDSLYFSGDGGPAQLVVAPLNNLLYNLDPANLAKHGLHPRYLHALVFVPLMLTALAVYSYGDALRAIVTRSLDARTALLLACIMFPLAAISRAPHQELRFLLPLVAPAAILGASRLCASRRQRGAWLLVNLALFVLYAGMHQAGVSRALAWCHERYVSIGGNDASMSVLFYETYMPPRHLAAIDSAFALRIDDLPADSLSAAIEALRQAAASAHHAFLVCPRQVCDAAAGVSLHLVNSFFPHFSGEHMPTSLSVDRLSLGVYELF
jgi:GPI mannosyltransferase 4